MLYMIIFYMSVMFILLTASTLLDVLFYILFHFFKDVMFLYKLQCFHDFKVFLH